MLSARGGIWAAQSFLLVAVLVWGVGTVRKRLDEVGCSDEVGSGREMEKGNQSPGKSSQRTGEKSGKMSSKGGGICGLKDVRFKMPGGEEMGAKAERTRETRGGVLGSASDADDEFSVGEEHGEQHLLGSD